MDIEKLKKVNQLATTLRAQGLAVGRDDAVKLSADMNLGIEDEGLKEIMNPVSEAETKVQEVSEEVATLEAEEKKEENSMNEEKFMSVLQDFANQFCAEINSLNDKIAEQEKIISELCVYHHKAQQAEQAAVNHQQAPMQPMERQETINVREEPQRAAPRSGGYDSNDVSIEQFFYCGTK